MDIREVERALRAILAPGQVTELRAFGVVLAGDKFTHKTVSGYFDDPEKAAQAVATIISAKGIYFTPNPVTPALLARAKNRIRPVGKGDSTTSDDNIETRKWLLIDLDPFRPSGISSTESEHQAAIDKAKSIREFLSNLGWPCPLLGDSGNGAHLMYRIDLPVNDDGLVKRVLESLAAQFDDEAVKVDTGVGNPARIWKLYGTIAGKGDSVPNRPHRISSLLEEPAAECAEVSESLLVAFAARLKPQPVPTKEGAAASAAEIEGWFDLEAWLLKSGLDIRDPKPWKDGRLWEISPCPWNADHVGGCAFIAQLGNGAITAGCHHN